jgi:pyruvate dehydrogenase (quinone)
MASKRQSSAIQCSPGPRISHLHEHTLRLMRETFPERQVISLSGDGGFAMLMGDFLTLVQQDLPVKVVVFNNSSLGFIEIEQKSSGFLDTWTTLKNPNFAAVAESIGVREIRLADPGEVESGITDAPAHVGPWPRASLFTC